MKSNLLQIITTLFLLLATNLVMAQVDSSTIKNKPAFSSRLVFKHSASDSLLTEFNNTIYTIYYNPKYWGQNKKPTFTLLKIDIDTYGKVSKIQFSDSADSAFVAAFTGRSNYHNDNSTIEKYAKIKNYKGLSILIPVYYEADFEKQPVMNFSYMQMEDINKFGKKEFTGKSVILNPIIIRILAEHNS